MKKIFTKTIYALVALFLLIGMSMPALAQYTENTITLNAHATAMTRDASGNIYVIEDPTGTKTGGEIFRYTSGTGTAKMIYNGSLVANNDDQNNYNYASGIAVDSQGNVYFTTDNNNNGNFYGDVVKMTYTKSTDSYAAMVYIAGTSGVGDFEGVAIDGSDNLYVLQYDPNGDGGVGTMEAAKYNSTGTSFTDLYDKLETNFSTPGTFSGISAFTCDKDGNVYVGDWFLENSNAYGGFVEKLTNNSGTYTATRLATNTYCTSLACDASDNLYATAATYTTIDSYTLVEYVNGAGSPITLYTGLNGTDSSWFPFGIAAATPASVFVIDANQGTNYGNYDQLTAPTVTSLNTSSGAADDYTNAASPVNYTLKFSTAITGLTASNFSLTTSGTSGTSVGTPTTTDNITWTVPVVTGSADGTIVLNLANATNLSLTLATTLPFVGQEYTIDRTAPTITVGSPSVGSTVSGPVTYSVMYADANFSGSTLALGNITLNKTGNANGTVALSGSAKSYTVTISSITGVGTLGISIASGTATDLAGNSAAASGASTTFNVVQPTITVPGGTTTVPSTTAGTAGSSTSFSISGSNLTTGNLTATAPTGFDVSSNNSTWGSTASIPETGTLGSTPVYVRLSASDGISTPSGNVSISGGGATTATQAVSGTVNSASTTITSLTSTTTSPTNATTLTFTATFASSVSGLNSGDFLITLSGVTGAYVTNVTGSGTSWTVTVNTGSGDGTIQLSMNSASGVTPSVSNLPYAAATYTIDKTSPTVAIGAPNVTYANSSTPVSWIVTWTDVHLNTSSINPAGILSNINTTSTATVSGTINLSPGSGGNPTTVEIVDVTGDGTLGFTVPAGSASDNAGNSAAASSPSQTVIIDNTPPTVTIGAPSVSLTNGGPVSYTVTYADANFNANTLSSSNITLNNGGTTATAGAITVTPVSSTVATVTLSGISGDGTLGISIAAGTATDLAGNSAPASSASTTFTVDNTPPTVSSITGITPSPSSPTNATSVTYTVTFDEAVTGVTSGAFTATESGVTNAGIAVTPTSSSVYSVTVSGISGNGTLRLDLNSSGTGIQDLAGNAISGGFTTGDVYTIDNTPPTALTLAADDPNPNNETQLDYTITFSEPVTGVDLTDFTAVTSSGLTAGAISVTPTSASTYNLSIANVIGNGTLQLSLNNSGTGIQDLAGNAITGGISGPIYTVNQTPPTVTSITATTPTNTNPTNATSVVYTVTFSEVVFGVDATDFAVTTSGTTGSVTNVTGSGTTWAVTVGGISGDGTLRLDLVTTGHAINDQVNNILTAGYTGGDIYTIDNTAPTVNLITGITPSPSSPTNATSVTYTVTFSEAVTGVDATDFTVTTGGTSGSVANVSGSGTTYTVTVGSITGTGTLRLDVNRTGDAITDLAGNTLTTGFTGGDTYTIDNTPPTATIGAPSVASISGNGSGSVTYSLTYADANFNTSAVSPSNITLNRTGTATGTIGVSGSGTSYTITISSITGAGTLGISVAPGLASDLAGNTDAGAGPSATFNVISSDASLSKLTVSTGRLLPAFNTGTIAYTDTVSVTVASIAVRAVTTDPAATETIGGTPVPEGTISPYMALTPGLNTIPVVITAADGVTRETYTIVVNQTSSDASLSKLTVSNGTLTPASASGTTSYTDNVSNTVSSIALRAVTTDPNATETINGTAVTEGTISPYMPLVVGLNNISVVVTAVDGVTKDTYTVAVTRLLPNVATLSKLTVSTGTLTPPSNTGISSYTENVADTAASIAVRAITTDPAATETINGTPVPEGTVSPYMPLAVGLNTITVIVTAVDGTTRDTITIAITRLQANVTTLAKLTVSSGTLSPAFASGTSSYTDNVDNTVSTIAVRAITTDPAATLTVNSTPVADKTVSPYMALAVGPNTIAVAVTAEDGTTMETYTITVTRAAPPVDNIVYQPVSVESPAQSPQLADDGIMVHQGLSPNGDGIDDFLRIDNITNYPDNRLAIMNRNGMLVYEAKGYDNASKLFDGHSNKNGAMQLPGTYFYELDYTVNGITKHKTGFLVLKY